MSMYAPQCIMSTVKILLLCCLINTDCIPTPEEIKECVTSHPAFKESPNYNLLMGNCRDRAKSILADCCMKINDASGRPARKGYVLRRYSESIYEEYGDKSILNLTYDKNSTPLL